MDDWKDGSFSFGGVGFNVGEGEAEQLLPGYIHPYIHPSIHTHMSVCVCVYI